MTVFEIPDKPKGKGRPRHGNGHTYTPKSTKDYEKYVQQCFAVCPTRKYYADKAICVDVFSFFVPPKRASKKARADMLAGKIYPTVKPDRDNIDKIVLDALNGVAYDDDKQIVDGRLPKRYAERAYVKVVIREMEEINDPG